MTKDSDQILTKMANIVSKCTPCGCGQIRFQCYLCDKNENHIATNGAKGSKIVQYFACQKFTEMTPSERFQLLRKKGYCIQCLFPSAYLDKGKHSSGKWQRNYVCKHQSHKKYPIKKHVLVCHEHRSNAENQQLLQEYKD